MVVVHRRHRGQCEIDDSSRRVTRALPGELGEVQGVAEVRGQGMGMGTGTATVVVATVAVHLLALSLGDEFPDWDVAARDRGHCTGHWATPVAVVGQRLVGEVGQRELLSPSLFLVPRFT